MVGPALANALAADRAGFNARFALARRRLPGLDGNAFLSFLASVVDPVAEAVARVRPERVGHVVRSAYDAALELAGQRLAGPGARERVQEEGWLRILPAAAPLLAEHPGRLVSAVGNALHQLSATPGARPGDWSAAVASAAPRCPDLATLLRFGQVAAWRAGLAHYRASALAAVGVLSVLLALAALGAGPGWDWPRLRLRLAADPWFDPGAYAPDSADARGPLRLAVRVGAFRGFGGLFAEPPGVAVVAGELIVSSGADRWALYADSFGAALHRTGAGGAAPGPGRGRLSQELVVDGCSVLRGPERLDLPELGRFASAAVTPHTLALTSPLTHAVILVSLT